MNTKKVPVVLCKHVSLGFQSVWHGTNGRKVPADYVQISEWVEVDFPLLPAASVQTDREERIAEKRRKLERELAELDGAA